MAARARYELPVLPTQASYEVSFSASPIAAGDDMLRNRLFNLCIEHAVKQTDDVATQIRDIARSLTFSDYVVLRSVQPSPSRAVWRVQPAAESESLSGGAIAFSFRELPLQVGMPTVVIRGNVRSATGKPVPHFPEDGDCLSATDDWPADDPELRQLAGEIIGQASSVEDQVRALLNWFSDPEHMRFAGATGSRYGVRQTLQQKHGHCWDYADLFVTLSRAIGIPARQVFGWLHDGQGHVWAEVSIDGKWHAVDPTSGTKCGSDYVPISHTETGHMTFLYASPVAIRQTDAE
ncbi:MAG: transglutaminase-like domain-containing protein [Pirellulaceae bacterium]